MRSWGPPVPPHVVIPNEEALRVLLEHISLRRLRLGDTMRALWGSVLRIVAAELSRRGVRAPGH